MGEVRCFRGEKERGEGGGAALIEVGAELLFLRSMAFTPNRQLVSVSSHSRA